MLAEQARTCLENGVLATIASLWKTEGDSVRIQSACCRALAAIVSSQPEGDRLVTCRAAVELRIHSFMKRFPEDVEAQISACQFAQYLLDEDDSQLDRTQPQVLFSLRFNATGNWLQSLTPVWLRRWQRS